MADAEGNGAGGAVLPVFFLQGRPQLPTHRLGLPLAGQLPNEDKLVAAVAGEKAAVRGPTCRMASATRIRAASPWTWPYRSLICLK